MKTRKNLYMLFVLVIVAFLLTSCLGSAASKAKEIYNQGQTLYVQATVDYSNFVACQVTENQNIEQHFTLVYANNWTVLQQNVQYRAAKNAVSEAAAAAPKATTSDNTEVIDFNKLPKEATPNGIMASGLAFSVYAIQEAQVIPVDPAVTRDAMKAVEVANNHKFQCAVTWNTSVGAYNTWRRQVDGRIAGDLANYFNIENMPKELPMYSVENFSTGAGPNTTDPYAPTQVKP